MNLLIYFNPYLKIISVMDLLLLILTKFVSFIIKNLKQFKRCYTDTQHVLFHCSFQFFSATLQTTAIFKRVCDCKINTMYLQRLYSLHTPTYCWQSFLLEGLPTFHYTAFQKHVTKLKYHNLNSSDFLCF